jgi:phosphoheptose isomerase
MSREDYEYFEIGRRDKKEEKPKFTDLLRETLKKVEDVIMVGNGSSFVDLDMLIDILSDPQQTE